MCGYEPGGTKLRPVVLEAFCHYNIYLILSFQLLAFSKTYTPLGMGRVTGILFGILLSVLLLPSMVQAESLRLAYEEYPPYEYVEGGQLVGTSIWLINEVCRRLGLEPEYVHAPFARALYDAKTGDVDGLFSIFYKSERTDFLYYPSEALGKTVTAIVVRDDSSVRIDSLEDIRQYTIGAVRGYSHGEDVDAMEGLNITEVASNAILLKMLGSGRIEMALCNIDVLSHLHSLKDYDWTIKTLKTLQTRPIYIGFSKSLGPRGKQLADDFDREIKNIRAGN